MSSPDVFLLYTLNVLAQEFAVFITIAAIIQNRANDAFQKRAFFQDRYGYRFDRFVAENRVDRQQLDYLLQHDSRRSEKAAIFFVQRCDNVPDHVARRYVDLLKGGER